jgi:hypothetical protein
MKEYILCGHPGRCCPKLIKYKYGWELTDDDGGLVTLTDKQLKELKKILNEILE